MRCRLKPFNTRVAGIGACLPKQGISIAVLAHNGGTKRRIAFGIGCIQRIAVAFQAFKRQLVAEPRMIIY